jgi:subtilisin family serine protease
VAWQIDLKGRIDMLFTRWKVLLLIAIGLLVSACGGGGGGGSGGGSTPPAGPSISIQPAAQAARVGQSATFSVSATGASTLSYQWQRNGTPISGATSSTYTLPVTLQSDNGAQFSVTITDSKGTVISSTVGLTLSPANASSACTYTGTSTSTDPLLNYQWHIKNNNLYFASDVPSVGTGFDLCMGGLWASSVLGTDVKVNVVDSGLEVAHEDLSARMIDDGSYNFVDGTTNPTNTITTGDHGTSVAGLIAATRGNALGGSGIAPSAKLQGYNLLSSTQLDSYYGIAFGSTSGYNATNSDIFNFSAGSTSAALGSPNSPQDTIYQYIASSLRSFKGGLFVKSAGNGFKSLGSGVGNTTYCLASGVSCQSANQDRTNTQYNAIVVAALNANGTKSSYSSTGSSIWVSGFGGEYGYDAGYVSSTSGYKPALLTTDQTGCINGYVRSGYITTNALNKGDGTGTSNPNCSYTAGFNGTSSAAPTVSGVIALMLQANPALTWRDVRHILATTARRVNPSQAPITNSTSFSGSSFTLEQGWVLNAGGYWYHNWYGFGLVNAAAAVAMAQTYTAGSLGTFVAETKSAAIGTTNIDFSSTGLTKTFAIAGTSPTTVEQAELTLYFGSGYQPICHQIELSSPAGTKSIVLNMDSAHTSASTNGVRFMSNAFYGEPAAGTWTVRFINSCTTQTLSTTSAQQLTIRGR